MKRDPGARLARYFFWIGAAVGVGAVQAFLTHRPELGVEGVIAAVVLMGWGLWRGREPDA